MMMKTTLYTLIILLFLACSDSNKSEVKNTKQTPTTQTLNLNGTWKFNTFAGDGSNYRDISPTKQDIILDNADANLVKTNGKWTVKSTPERSTKMWGANYLSRNFSGPEPDAYVTYKLPKIDAGYYEHFVFYPYGSNLFSRFRIKHGENENTAFTSQRNRPGQWISIGIYKIEDYRKSVIKVDSLMRQTVNADAIMLRPIDAEHFAHSQLAKSKAYTKETNDHNWHNLVVPGNWGMINQYSTYTGKGWYRKNFALPKAWKAGSDERIRVKFEGVYHLAKVYLNGEYIGSHQGGFTPFEFDVTDKINFNGKNLLAVEADNSAIVGATWNWGGIIRDVNLVKTKDVRINYQYIHAEPNLTTGEAKLSLQVRIENNSNQARTLDLTAKINKASDKKPSPTHSLTNLSKTITIAANSTSKFDLVGELSKDQVQLWHFDSPHLYQLTSKIKDNNQLIHSRKDRFGIRKIELTESKMLLNGEPIRVGGYNRISDHRYWGSSEPEELLVKDMQLMKDSGANFMRIMHGTQNKRLIELCDEMGILIFEETNIRELGNPEFVAPEYTINKQWIKEMIERDINHPSIIGWSVGNELKNHYDYVDKMLTYVKTKLDPHRLVTNVSNTGYRPKETPENDPLGLSDIMMQNIYQKDPEKVLTTIHERWPTKPMFISEYGLGRFTTPSLDNDYANATTWHNMLRGRNTNVIGTSLWSFNDYRSGYGETLEEENRAWGIVNSWRQKRRGYTTFQKELSPVKGILLNNTDLSKGLSDVTIPVRDASDYPSYTMRAYTLDWQLRDKQGIVLQQKSLNLPTLSPDSGSWNGSISWIANHPEAFDLNIRLLSTNGFIRYQTKLVFKQPEKPTITGVISGHNTIRVLFNKQFDAQEHIVRFKTKSAEWENTTPTIGSHIDLETLVAGNQYQIELVAINNKGQSTASTTVTARLTNQLLPPVIWDAMIRDNKLVVGYSGKKDDRSYTLAYGYSANTLDLEVKTSGRGMLTADIGEQQGTIYYKLKRHTDTQESAWSLVSAVAPQNNKY